MTKHRVDFVKSKYDFVKYSAQVVKVIERPIISSLYHYGEFSVKAVKAVAISFQIQAIEGDRKHTRGTES